MWWFVLQTECDEMWYGVNCSQQCSGHCKNNSTCHHVTGQCDGGCNAGWTGTTCTIGNLNLWLYLPSVDCDLFLFSVSTIKRNQWHVFN